MSRFRLIEAAVAAALLAGIGGAVFAQATTAEEHITARREFMKTIPYQTQALRAGDLEAAKAAAQRLSEGFRALGSHFPEGSLSSTTSAAKADVFSRPEAFQAELDKAIKATDEILAATEAGDQNRINAAAAELAKSCSSCHQQFRGLPVA